MSVVADITRCASHPTYGATPDGRIFRLTRSRFGRRVPFELARWVNGNGYEMCTIQIGGESRPSRVHRLVADAFLSCPDQALDVAHKDGIRTHNSVENLYWATRFENMADAARHGTLVRGSVASWAKLDETKVREIRLRFRQGERNKDLAEEFGVSPSTICTAAYGKRWKHVAA